MGLDVGTQTIGVALSDETGTIAGPLTTVRRKALEKDLAQIVELAARHEVGLIVVGMPLEMSGRVGRSARWVLGFVEALKNAWTGSVEIWDERLSTVAAERMLLEADLRRSHRKRVVDQVAAAVILQNFLDNRQNQTES